MLAFCDECGHEFEVIQKPEAVVPVANGYEPDYCDAWGYIFKVPHRNHYGSSCIATLLVMKEELNI